MRSCAANTRYPSLSQFVSPRQLTGYLPTFQLHSLQRRRDITQVLFPVLTSSDRNTHQYDGLDRGPLVTCPSLAFEACATFEWPGDPQSTSPFHRPRCFCPPPLDTPGIAQHTSHPRTLLHPGKPKPSSNSAPAGQKGTRSERSRGRPGFPLQPHSTRAHSKHSNES